MSCCRRTTLHFRVRTEKVESELVRCGIETNRSASRLQRAQYVKREHGKEQENE